MFTRLLVEMAVLSEKEVFNMQPVASVSTEKTVSLEGKPYKDSIIDIISNSDINPKYTVDAQAIGAIYSHHCVGRPLKKASLTALSPILNNCAVVASWGKGHNKRQKTGMVAAPILIDGIKYLCEVTLQMNAKRKITPIAIVLKDENGQIVNEEKVVNNVSVHDKSNGNPTLGVNHHGNADTSQDANQPLDVANIQQNIQITKDNNKENINENMSFPE